MTRAGWILAGRLVWGLLAAAVTTWMALSVRPALARFGEPCAPDCLPLALTATTEAQLHALGISPGGWAVGIVCLDLLLFLIFAGAALLVVLHRSDQLMGWLISVSLLIIGAGVTQTASTLAVVYPTVFAALVLLGGVAFLPVFFLFPDGRFVPRWTAAFAGLQLAVAIVYALFAALPRAPLTDRGLGVVLAVSALTLAAALYGQLRRYQLASEETRAQLRWALLGVGALVAASMLWGVSFEALIAQGLQPSARRVLLLLPVTYALTAVFPVGLCVAVFRHRLWEVETVLSPTLVYGLLSVFIVGSYGVLVGGLSTLLQLEDTALLSLVATGAIAIAAHPVRERLQLAVNRRLFGQRDAPLEVLQELSALDADTPDALLEEYVRTLARTLKLPYVGLRKEGVDLAESGAPEGPLVELPLHHGGERLGSLRVSPRRGQRRLGAADRELLRGVAVLAGALVRSLELAEHLQRSRHALVTGRAEEQRRMRNDLHDGLGPMLAAQGLKLSLARQRIDTAPAESARLLDELKAESRQTVDEIRRLVQGLRPPALDELGLLGVLRQEGRRVVGATTLSVSASPEPLPALPAAVEVAAYRLVMEALTNAARHARGARVEIALEVAADALTLTIDDDGPGFSGGAPGIGLRSMRERARELDGELRWEASPLGGARVFARLRLGDEREDES